ncbi:uncharacterized protein LOC131680117 [Topomyia yanbarensis]|uniref:uncharacterized protein LOC131680117 n=1 Tax=Topomyia yanbarensis TaxID=2498891 RepID=UPI00273C9C2A|nr:uncharacterized protein LOC131680117 [Topomyia yanbarensis]
MYFVLKASLQGKLPPRRPARPMLPSMPPMVQAQPVSNMRLPEISLKQFSGKLDDWVQYRDPFVSLIHNNPQLGAVQKLHYLRATLSGEAAGILLPLELSANNYTVAWKILREGYEKKKFLIKRNMSGLLALFSLKRESSSGLSELADEFDRHVHLLDKLENTEDHWNSFLIERLSSCLDSISLREWETQTSEVDRPTYKQILDFVHKRSRILQTLTLSHNGNAHSETKPFKPRLATVHVASQNIPKCPSCKQAHLLFQCDQFRNLTPQQRFEFVKKHGLCINCLKGNHLSKDCSSGSCKSCAKNHSLLHLPPVPTVAAQSSAGRGHLTSALTYQPAEAFSSPVVQSPVANANTVGHSVASPLAVPSSSHSFSVGIAPSPSSVDNLFGIVTNHHPYTSCQSTNVNPKVRNNIVMLSTAIIKVKDADNTYQFARALLDSGFQPSFITEAISTASFEAFQAEFAGQWYRPIHRHRASCRSLLASGIDIIIGAELFFTLLENQQISREDGYALLQKTVLGYIVCGKVMEPVAKPNSVQSSHVCTDDLLDSQLERFWEVENFDDGRAFTSYEQVCEDYYTETVSRGSDGRYTVRLPL